MLKIVDDKCRMQEGKMVIVVEGKDPEEVLSMAAKRAAIEKAVTFGYQRMGFNGQTGSYPVDEDGNQYEDMNKQARDGKIAAYRNDILLMAGL